MRAAKRDQPEPARFPVTLFAVGDSTAPERCRAWIDHLEVIPIGGDHRSAIELPHVADALRRGSP